MAKKKKAPKRGDWATDQNVDLAQVGQFVYVAKGKNEGRYGVLEEIVSWSNDGWPDTGVVVTRDDDSERLVVAYDDLVAADSGVR